MTETGPGPEQVCVRVNPILNLHTTGMFTITPTSRFPWVGVNSACSRSRSLFHPPACCGVATAACAARWCSAAGPAGGAASADGTLRRAGWPLRRVEASGPEGPTESELHKQQEQSSDALHLCSVTAQNQNLSQKILLKQ